MRLNIESCFFFQRNRYLFTGSAKGTAHARYTPSETVGIKLPENLTSLFNATSIFFWTQNLKMILKVLRHLHQKGLQLLIP